MGAPSRKLEIPDIGAGNLPSRISRELKVEFYDIRNGNVGSEQKTLAFFVAFFNFRDNFYFYF
jgi:hypothetical protein